MVTAAVGATYEDVLADVQALKKEFPALFEGQKDPEGGNGAPGPASGGARMPGGDPSGRPPKPSGGEDKFAAGAERFKKKQEARPRYEIPGVTK